MIVGAETGKWLLIPIGVAGALLHLAGASWEKHRFRHQDTLAGRSSAVDQ
jgi:hypothetical protein